VLLFKFIIAPKYSHKLDKDQVRSDHLIKTDVKSEMTTISVLMTHYDLITQSELMTSQSIWPVWTDDQ